ncbi:hypothetical protein ALC53_01212 [Atta colombica]|uniref:Uncharacterized protein n=1 Tax=Atta colombica TaxID=520822 RepID=A0A195BU62_9HYME|nr:hypothetical protein ALC53_01212 [Atta colombica]
MRENNGGQASSGSYSLLTAADEMRGGDGWSERPDVVEIRNGKQWISFKRRSTNSFGLTVRHHHVAEVLYWMTQNLIYQMGKIVSDGWTAARNFFSKSREEEEEEEEDTKEEEEDEAKQEKREEGECFGITSRGHAPRVHVCPRRAGAIECQTGRTIRKSPVGAVSRGFLTESSRTRAAGNSIRCPCTTGTIGLSHATTRGQRAPSHGVFDVSHTGTLGTFPTRQVDVTARGNARGVSSKSEEPCRCSPYALPRSSSRTNSASPNEWGASFAFLEDARSSRIFL